MSGTETREADGESFIRQLRRVMDLSGIGLSNIPVVIESLLELRGKQMMAGSAKCQLKHLSFKFMRIAQRSAYSERFPNLKHLKLDECRQLEEIPIGLGDIYTLEMIEIRNWNPAVVLSAHKIKRDQMNKGNNFLKVSIFQA
ncbi:hypothetical protein POM88_018294 [Heracleum sosnowskyi]|uniref:Disease resistance protein n=1 Tax=Heracleum sosnowskyi TaxID=360622 RepID=A0AAD8ISL0_9APIA|nr:hypothetical protein POM88_018294 [Heracleum sosnowskyi]